MSILCCLALAFALPGKFYPSVSLTSDYRYNGVSYSGREPTPQASLHWLGPRGWYAGVWTSGVDFDDPGNTSIEGDVYLGRAVDFGRTRLAGEVLYTFFPDKTFRGPTYDFLQLKVRGSRSFDALSVGALAAWTPEASYRSGTAWRVAIDASYALTGGSSSEWTAHSGTPALRRPGSSWRSIFAMSIRISTNVSAGSAGAARPRWSLR
jgi:uncharacterized protein (TIGR02001 family)